MQEHPWVCCEGFLSFLFFWGGACYLFTQHIQAIIPLIESVLLYWPACISRETKAMGRDSSQHLIAGP